MHDSLFHFCFVLKKSCFYVFAQKLPSDVLGSPGDTSYFELSFWVSQKLPSDIGDLPGA